MKSEFKLLMATLLVGFSAATLSSSTHAGALGDAVGGALGGAKGTVGGALGDVGGALGGSSGGSNSTAGGSTTAGATATTKASVVLRKKNFAKNQVTVTLGKTTNVNARVLSAEIDLTLGFASNPGGSAPTSTRRDRSAAAQMFDQMSAGEQRRLIRKCSQVLASAGAFDRDLVALCQMIARLDNPPSRSQPAEKVSRTKATSRHLASIDTVILPAPAASEPKLDKTEVVHCLGDFALPRSRILELQGQLPGCVVWMTH